MIEILFNNEAVRIKKGSSLKSFLENRDLSTKNGIAVAINGAVISRVDWDQQILNANDKLMVISATAGG